MKNKCSYCMAIQIIYWKYIWNEFNDVVCSSVIAVMMPLILIPQNILGVVIVLRADFRKKKNRNKKPLMKL